MRHRQRPVTAVWMKSWKFRLWWSISRPNGSNKQSYGSWPKGKRTADVDFRSLPYPPSHPRAPQVALTTFWTDKKRQLWIRRRMAVNGAAHPLLQRTHHMTNAAVRQQFMHHAIPSTIIHHRHLYQHAPLAMVGFQPCPPMGHGLVTHAHLLPHH